MYLCLHFVSVPPLSICLTFLWPFFSPSVRPVLMVPGYRQVSGRRKDLFCCFGSPVSVGSQGKGWGGSTTHLCLRLIWPLSCGHAPLHCSVLLRDSFYTVGYDIWCPLPLAILSLCTLTASFSWLWTSGSGDNTCLTLHPWHVYTCMCTAQHTKGTQRVN